MTVLATFMPVCLAFLPLAKSNPASQLKKARQKQARASASEKGNGHHATSHDPPAADTTWLLQGLRPVDTRAGGGNGAPLAADAGGDDRRGDRVVMPTPLFYSPYFVAALLVLQLLTTASGALLPGLAVQICVMLAAVAKLVIVVWPGHRVLSYPTYEAWNNTLIAVVAYTSLISIVVDNIPGPPTRVWPMAALVGGDAAILALGASLALGCVKRCNQLHAAVRSPVSSVLPCALY